MITLHLGGGRGNFLEDPNFHLPAISPRFSSGIMLFRNFVSTFRMRFPPRSNRECNLQNSFANEICALLGYYVAYSGNSLPMFRDNFLTLENGADRLSRNVCKELPLRCVINHKSAEFIYFAAEA